VALIQNPVVEAYKSMRKGVLYLIIAWLLIGIGLSSVVFGMFNLFALTATRGMFHGIGAIMGLAIAIVIIFAIGLVIALIGLWGNFIPGVSMLAKAMPELSTASSLVRIGLFYGLIVLLIGLLTIFIVIGIPIIVIGYIMLILGYIGLIILCFKLNELEKNVLYLAAGILFIIAIFIGLAGFIAWILLYIALGDSIAKASQAQPTPLTTITTPPSPA